jgi:hypothetical protein
MWQAAPAVADHHSRRETDGMEPSSASRERDASFSDNPSFAAQEGTAVDPATAAVDYLEEPGVGGVSGTPGRPDEAEPPTDADA